MMTEEEKAVLWLAACTKFDYREKISLLRAAKNPTELFENFEKFSQNVLKTPKSGLYNIDRTAREKELQALIADLEKKGRFVVAICSDDYPHELERVQEPPLVLYGEGNRELLGRDKFCIVGSRIIPPWAEKTGKHIAGELADHFVIVTGLAEGGDSAAIDGAIRSGNLICVLPNGLDECYPAAHATLKRRVREKGLLLSECPPRERVHKGSFHARNRILAGLSKGVLVLSASERSGTLITANCALDCGTDVFALPHNIGLAQGAGCNNLLKHGAYLVTETADILSVYGITPKKKGKIPLDKDEERVLNVLRDGGEVHTAVIAEKTGLKIYEVAAVLSALELKGLVTKCGGNQYSAL